MKFSSKLPVQANKKRKFSDPQNGYPISMAVDSIAEAYVLAILRC